MIRAPRISLISMILVSVIVCGAVAESEEDERVQDATTVLSEIMDIPADASVAAGPVGRSAMAATDEDLKAEIYSYSRARGLFAGKAPSER